MNASASWTTRHALAAALVLGAAAVAGCGGSDDASPEDSSAAGEVDTGADSPTSTDTPTGTDTGAGTPTGTDAGAGTVDDGSVADETAPGSAATESDDADGDGSNDPAQQGMDDAGIDLDLDELEETVTGFNTGDGGGRVTIDGSDYTFDASVCIAQGPSFLAQGPGTGPDGTPAWFDISYSEDYDFDSDGELDTSLDLFIEVGKTEMFGEGSDDQPDWAASKVDSASMTFGEDISVEFDGTTLSGSGPINDFNGVAVPFGETAPMTFQATCS